MGQGMGQFSWETNEKGWENVVDGWESVFGGFVWL